MKFWAEAPNEKNKAAAKNKDEAFMTQKEKMVREKEKLDWG